MKKSFLHTICIAVLSVLLLFSGTACSVLKESKVFAEYATVTVVNEQTEQTYELEIGKTASITIPTKLNHICTGIYDAQEGGQMYFDLEGDSTAAWQKTFPTRLYAQFKNVIGMTYTSEIDNEEEPAFVSAYASHAFIYDLPAEFLAALKCNSSLTVEVVLHYDIIGTSSSGNEMRTYVSSTRDSEGLLEKEYYMADYDSFTQKKLKATCKAKQLSKNGYVYAKIWSCYGWEHTRIKNVFCTLTILETAQS